jgi:hypothetical protein
MKFPTTGNRPRAYIAAVRWRGIFNGGTAPRSSVARLCPEPNLWDDLPAGPDRALMGDARTHPPPLPRTARLLAHLLRRCSRRDDCKARRQPIWRPGIADSIPAAAQGEDETGTSATFEDARADFERARAVFLSKRTEADFQEWRDGRDWHERKYAMWARGKKLPTQKPSSLMKCPRGETFDSHRLEHTVIHVPHISKAQRAHEIRH